MHHGDHLLLGVDRVKENHVLHAAYNDAQGITAEFNLNVLDVLNRELNADFNTDDFTHSASFNTEKARIEMRLVSNTQQEVNIDELDESIQFAQGDDILTEISQKYTYNGIEDMLKEANFTITDHYQDKDAYFSLVLACK